MNFYNDEENEKKEGAPALPRAASPFKKTSAFGKAPLFSRTAGSLMDRLKNLSRRDMALVGLGLSVLVMVPVAEYMMSQPPQENLLEGGWGGKEKLGDMPYEPGVNGLSQGSADGSGEVITPLSSRDPVSLILGSQPAQPAVSAPVYTPPATSMRDAMRDAGREAFSAATKSAGAPTVIPKMAGGLRNMSFFGGGESSRTSGNLGGGKIIDEARSASSKAAKRSMVGPVAIAGYKGVASTPNSASKGAFEKLRAAADKSAGNFSGGSAMRALDKAAADALEIGKGSGGMGAGGDSDKTGKTSGNSVKGYEHNRSGETLAEQAAKMRQQKALEWEFYKKYEIPKQIINAIVGAVSNVLGEFIKDKLMSAFGMYPPNIKCWNPAVCPNGSNCGDLAVTYLGANWWNNGKKLTDMCTVGGNPVAIKQVVGKESASSTSEVCICGKGERPSVGGASSGAAAAAGGADPAANPGGTPSATPAHHAQYAVANLKDYDDQLRAIAAEVAKAEADPSKITEETARGLVGAFQNLYPLADKKVTAMGNLRDTAQEALSSFGTKKAASTGKMQGVRPQYEAFKKQCDDLAAICKSDTDCNVKMKAKISVGSGTDKSVPASADVTITDPVKKAIRAALREWNNTGIIYFNAADGLLTSMDKWDAAYKQEVPKLVAALPVITGKEGTIRSLVTEIAGKGSPMTKMRNLSGRLKDVQASTVPATGDEQVMEAAKTPLYMTAVGQRAAKWETFWEAKHDIVATETSETEATEFSKWEAAVANPGEPPQMPYQPENYVNFQMRATMMTRSMAVQAVNLGEVDKYLDRTTASIEAVRKAILDLGVDPSYLPGGSTGGGSTGGDNTGGGNTGGGNTGGGNTGGGNTGGGNTGGGNTGGANTAARPISLRMSESRFAEMNGQVGALAPNPSNANYEKHRALATAAVAKAGTEMEKMKAAKATLESTTATQEEKTAAKAAMDTAQKEFNTQIGAARSNHDQALRYMSNPAVVGKPSQTIINVQGGNANANANANAGANTTVKPGSVTNSNVVQQQVTPKPKPDPVVQPKPKAPSSFLLGSVRFATKDNSGDTVVYDSPTMEVPWYSVTCSRQADGSFKITSGRKTNLVGYISVYTAFNGKACR